jgi:hypothetical protein
MMDSKYILLQRSLSIVDYLIKYKYGSIVPPAHWLGGYALAAALGWH